MRQSHQGRCALATDREDTWDVQPEVDVLVKDG